jgi:hypothetical protein
MAVSLAVWAVMYVGASQMCMLVTRSFTMCGLVATLQYRNPGQGQVASSMTAATVRPQFAQGGRISVLSPCVSDHDLAIPWVTSLVPKPECCVTHGALHRVPLNLPSSITPLLQVQVTMCTFRTLVADKPILIAGGDRVVAQTFAYTPELYTHATHCCSKVLCAVYG